MNFNGNIQGEYSIVLNTGKDEAYQPQIPKPSGCDNRLVLAKFKHNKQNPNKTPLMRGKQNDSMHINDKNLVTNHSFNGFFNQNIRKVKKAINQSIDQAPEYTDTSQQSYQINSQANFNSNGKIYNLQFTGDSSKNQGIQQSMHSEVKSFMKKYFPDNFQAQNFYEQYVTLNDFVQILFEEFQSIVGTQNSINLIQQFTGKIFLIFGGKIYFEDLFQKTIQNGLIGLIFQIFKLIEQNQIQNNQLKQRKINKKALIYPKNSRLEKNVTNSINNSFINQKSTKKTSQTNLQPQFLDRSDTTKISLENFFGNSLSRVQFRENSTWVSEQNMQEIKIILQDYIQSMYQEAEMKINRKLTQEMKKVNLKYKQTQKLLEKVNKKTQSHYDSIQVQKQCEKKIKLMNQKTTQLQSKIKKLELQVKLSKEELQKQKLINSKVDQQFNRMKEKLQKYQNAIFQKAMEKSPVSNNHTKSSIKDQYINNKPIYQQNTQNFQENIVRNPIFEVRIDTVTENRPFVRNPTTYSPYISKNLRGPLTPTLIKQIQRVSVSPIKQRISFTKTQNPAANINEGAEQCFGDNSRILNSKFSTTGQSDKLNVSNVQKFQIGEKINLRPLSPIGKLGQTNNTPPQNLGYQHATYNVGNQSYNHVNKPLSPYIQRSCLDAGKLCESVIKY